MIRRAARLAIAALLLLTAPVTASAQGSDLDARWREMFRREPVPPAADGRPRDADRVALGALLFADPRLSGDGRRSCATCHRPARSFTDGRRQAQSLSTVHLPRNTPALWNLAWGKSYFWDGRAPTLEAQVREPIEAANEMAGDWPTILALLGADAGLVQRFAAAFADARGPSQAAVVAALAAYLRTLVSPRTRFDAWVEGDASALHPAELRGFRLFTGRAGCVLCHVGWRFTDDKFHDIGLRGTDAGRGGVAGGTPGLMAFKTPGLRELAYTAPYMHDGSLPNLQAVVAHYAGRLQRRPSLATNINRDLRLNATERTDLIAFLRTLSSEKGPAGVQPARPR